MTKKFTIYCNRKPVSGPWGGGNRILQSFIAAAGDAGHNVIFSLSDAFRKGLTVDIIFCLDPRQGSTEDELSHDAIMSLFPNKASRPFVVQRVGDIGTHGKPDLTKLVIRTTLKSDFVIFPSHWACNKINDIHRNTGNTFIDCIVIENTPDPIFYSYSRDRVEIPEKNIKFATHHWSMNEKKGFAFYNELNEWCKNNGHTFTFYGRAAETATFKSAGVFNANELCKLLPEHDVYITASEEEAGANHILEAMACGLPVLYHSSGGSIPEYVSKNMMGFSFIDMKSFEISLDKLSKQKRFAHRQEPLSAGESILMHIITRYDVLC